MVLYERRRKIFYDFMKKELTHAGKCDSLIQNAAEDSRCRKA